MTALNVDGFSSFVHEVTGFEPFPWQRRLLERVLECGWPSLLDLPTGTGKTTTLLIALYALAVAPERSYRRIALVVDRRIIVDQIGTVARGLKTALADPGRATCQAVATRLCGLSGDPAAPPVRVVHLRGGIPRDDTWIGTPDQPTMIASTVDQVGSRLLFRGYGVSEGMRPVHAGVLARDTLYLLDEVHLATAFEQTLSVLEGTYADWAERGGTGRGFRVVRMSATPRQAAVAGTEPFALDAADRAHPVLAERLDAARPARLQLVKTGRGTDAEGRATNRARVAAMAVARAQDAAKAGARTVGVVVNRVDTARRVAAQLVADGATGEVPEVHLLTGRMRPFEKDQVQAALARVAGCGATRPASEPPAFVVATSCIEAGADLDFEALVTEAASFDALRQRFGRLNRLGRHRAARAWILGRRDQLGARAEPDPIYGEALRETWGYLMEVAEDEAVDFGLGALPVPEPARLATMLPPSSGAPLLFPSYLDQWAETRPAPHPDPDVALWLHGKDAEPARDLQFVFRGDLPAMEERPVEGSAGVGRPVDGPAGVERPVEGSAGVGRPVDGPARVEGRAEAPDGTGRPADEWMAAVAEALEFLPPTADEVVAVPIGEGKRWLGETATVWRWTARGVEAARVAHLRAGDTVVVPAQAGGLGRGTWDPTATEPVEDVAERATWQARGVAKLRLDRATMPPWLAAGCPMPPATEDPERLEEARVACVAWLDALRERLDTVPEPWRPLLRAVTAPGSQRRLRVAQSARGLAPIWRLAVTAPGGALEATTEDTVSAFTGVEVSLVMHLRDVEAWATGFAQRAGLDPEVAADVALAAWLHDVGKADPRFQAMLRGGDPIAVAGGETLAKSRQFGSAAARQRAQERSGWPAGLRHELVSLALLEASPTLCARAHDLDLVAHLVASHHGWCRPWVPAVVDPTPTRVQCTLDTVALEVSTEAVDDDLALECAARFARLGRRYGWHGLAYLEALVRLGDHRASANPGARPQEAS